MIKLLYKCTVNPLQFYMSIIILLQTSQDLQATLQYCDALPSKKNFFQHELNKCCTHCLRKKICKICFLNIVAVKQQLVKVIAICSKQLAHRYCNIAAQYCNVASLIVIVAII